jgi:signal transduction histidine kinase
MQITEPTRKLLYQHEVLRAKLELKNHLLESVVREIYEQTGQVLSLARFRLAAAEGRLGESFKPEIAEAGNLVSEAISKLRKLSKNLFPEQEILTDSGFIDTLYEELQMDLSENPQTLQVSGTPATLAQEPGVILLAITLSTVALIRKLADENTLSMKILYTETDILISFSYHGKPIDLGTSGNLEENDLSESLTVRQRLQLIRGSITSNPAYNNSVGYDIRVPL